MNHNHEYKDREDFMHKVVFDPRDYGLAISTDIDFASMDHRILQVFARFYNDGEIHNNGSKCFFMSHLLRRVLVLHGIEAHVQQVTSYYTNLDRGWRQIIGEPMNITHGGAVDSHSIVVTKDYLLDFSVLNAIFYAHGLRAPIAFIAKSDPELWSQDQDFGEFGVCSWHKRRNHRDTKNIIYENRDDVLRHTANYFQRYRM